MLTAAMVNTPICPETNRAATTLVPREGERAR